MAKGSFPSMSGVLAGMAGVSGFFGSCAPRLIRAADGTRCTSTDPQLGQAIFCEAKSPAEPNQPSNRCPSPQSRSKTIIYAPFYNAAVTPLVVLHGVGGGHAAWDRQVSRFRYLGYECLAWDQPGYGGTPLIEPYDLERVSEALRKILPPKAFLVGHSMGGLIAQEAYARYPELVKGMCLCFTSPAFAGKGEFAQQFIAQRIGPLDEGKSMAEVAARLMPTMRGAKSDPSGLALAERIMASIPPQTYRKAVHLLTTFDRRANLPNISVPTLLVAGSDDRTAPPAVMEKMAQKIPGAEYVLLEGCGHLGPMDQPEEFNAVLEKFLKKQKL